MSQFGYRDPFADIYGRQPQPQTLGVRPPNPFPPLTPEEEQSTLSRITGKITGGLGYIGGVLDKTFGGRAVRGLLGGKPEELLSVLPGSDTLGLTNEANRVSGKDLLTNMGFLDKGDDSWAGTIGGIGAELALDPATYLSFGASALTPLGKAATKAYVMPRTIGERLAGLAKGSPELEQLAAHTGRPAAELAGQRLGGHVGVGLPFADPLAVFDLTGPLGAAGKAGNAALGFVPFGHAAKDVAGVIGNQLGSLFQKSKGGRVTPEGQEIAQGISSRIPGEMAAARTQVYDVADLLEKGVPGAINPDRSFNAEIGKKFGSMIENALPLEPGYAPAVEGYKKMMEGSLSRLNKAGKPDLPLSPQTIPGTDQQLGFLSRQSTEPLKTSGAGGFRRNEIAQSTVPGREKVYTGLPKESLNEISTNKAWSGPNATATPLEAATQIRQNILKVSDAERANLRQLADAGQLPIADVERLADLEARTKQADHLADWARGLDPWHAETGTGKFSNHPLDDAMAKLQKDTLESLKAEGLHKGLASIAMPAAEAGPGAKSLAQTLKDAGLTLDTQSTHGMSANPALQGAAAAAGGPLQATEGAMYQTMKELMAAGKAQSGETLESLGSKWFVPESVHADIVRATQALTTPAGMEKLVHYFDSITNLTKAAQTTLWPANKARNQAQALTQNFLHGGFDPGAGALGGGKFDPGAYMKPWMDAKAIHEGQAVESLNRIKGYENLPPQEAYKQFTKELATQGVYGRAPGQQARQIIGGKELPAPLKMYDAPHQGFMDILPQAGENLTKPLAVRGAFGHNVDVFGPVKAGHGIDMKLDDINRGSLYLAKRLQGYSEGAAAEAVRAAHFDFGNLTQVEKGFMRRAIPFYGWMRQSVASTIDQLSRRPGGAVASGLKAASDLEHQTQQGFTPEYLSKGLALPIGKEDDGTQRYLSSIGLSVEDLGRLVNPRGPAQTGMEWLSELNPLIKGPLEFATGKQFFSGRDLADLSSKGLTGNVALDQAIMNSPLSRVATSARTLMDERKGLGGKLLNLGTGLKVTDVDMEKQKSLAARDYLEELFKSDPSFRQRTDFYVRPEDMAGLSPKEVEQMRLYKTLQKQASEAAKKKRAVEAK